VSGIEPRELGRVVVRREKESLLMNEGGARGWTLRGASSVVRGNEPFYVRSSRDSRSLALPAGSSATTPYMCGGVEHPTLRLFAVNAGSALSTLKVEIVFKGPLGLPVTAPVTTLVSAGGWSPTAPALLLANLTAARGD
jgi:hypothetical protein